MIPQDMVSKIVTIIQSFVPGYQLKNKSDNFWMRFLGFFAGPFFMTSVWSTIGSTTWRPNYIGPQEYIILSHEGIHCQQYQKYGTFLMMVLYLFPISLVPLLIAPILFLSHLWWVWIGMSLLVL